MNQTLSPNFFQLFNLSPNFDLDPVYLQQQLRELQKQFHPDNYVGKDSQFAAHALQVSGQINQAYTTLSQPLSRAIYLLEIFGVKVDLVYDSKFSTEFLMAQIELREEIEEAEASADSSRLLEIEAKLQAASSQLLARISQMFQSANYLLIVQEVKHLAFYNKLEQLVNNLINQL